MRERYGLKAVTFGVAVTSKSKFGDGLSDAGLIEVSMDRHGALRKYPYSLAEDGTLTKLTDKSNQGIALSGQLHQLLFLLMDRDGIVSSREIRNAIWPGKSGGAVKTLADRLRKAFEQLEGPGGRRVIAQRGFGYVFDQAANVTMTSDTFVDSALSEPSPDVLRLLINAGWSRHPIDGYLELERSPGWLGWSAPQISISPTLSDFEPSDDFRALMRRYPAPGKINQRYGLRKYALIEPFTDADCRVNFEFTAGDWRHVFALQRASKRDCQDDRAFWEKYGSTWNPIEKSMLYHNVNTEVVVITRDQYAIVGLRGNAVEFSNAKWSFSLEEQMLRSDPSPRGDRWRDADLFDCAHAGVLEELGVRPIKEKSKLLSFGFELENFTAAFLMLCHLPTTMEETVLAWKRESSDPHELVALASVPARPENLKDALLAPTWVGGNADFRDNEPKTVPPLPWHLTSRARIHCVLQHLLHSH